MNPQKLSMRGYKSFDGNELLGGHVDADTWLTPRFVLGELGEFDLDPCAYEGAPNWTNCPRFYTKAVDGLIQEWAGRVFMNPPFSNTVPWLEKHAAHGYGISLVPASIESVVWRSLVWPRARGILFLHGRTRFSNPDGSTTTGRPLRSIALIAWSTYDKSILSRCSLAGVFVDNWSQR